MLTDSEKQLLREIAAGKHAAFKKVFDQHFVMLCRQLYTVVPDAHLAEDIVQEVFIEFWNKRNTISIQRSIKAYLRMMARNRLLNHLRAQRLKWDELETVHVEPSTTHTGERSMEISEFEAQVHHAIEQLPPKCRMVFALSRFEEMTYREIAEHLGISIKTVENQMSRAIKSLRNQIMTKNKTFL